MDTGFVAQGLTGFTRFSSVGKASLECVIHKLSHQVQTDLSVLGQYSLCCPDPCIQQLWASYIFMGGLCLSATTRCMGLLHRWLGFPTLRHWGRSSTYVPYQDTAACQLRCTALP